MLQTTEGKKNSTKNLKVDSENIKHEVCLDEKENGSQNIVSDKTRKSERKILQKSKETSSCIEKSKCLNVSDTAEELANCQDVSDTAKELANCLDVSDTAKELANCQDVSNTSKELANFLVVSNSANELANCLDVSNTAKELANWGLPQSILEKYKEKGISTMFDWQVRKSITSFENSLFRH